MHFYSNLKYWSKKCICPPNNLIIDKLPMRVWQRSFVFCYPLMDIIVDKVRLLNQKEKKLLLTVGAFCVVSKSLIPKRSVTCTHNVTHIQHSNHNLQVLYASTTLCIKVENGKSSLFVCEHTYIPNLLKKLLMKSAIVRQNM